MPDKYIDYDEVSEYGGHAAREIKKLSGSSDLVDADKLADKLADSVAAVESETAIARGQKNELRDKRGSTEDAYEEARDVVTRFYYHLRSLPTSVDFNFDAFYEGQTLGDTSKLKPADLRAKAGYILSGFDAPKNKSITTFASWKADISAAHDALNDALNGKGGAKKKTFVATASLIAAREKFLAFYHGVAKPLVRGLLNDVGRESEYKEIFRDLLVNEGATKDAPAPEATPTTAPQGPSTPP